MKKERLRQTKKTLSLIDWIWIIIDTTPAPPSKSGKSSGLRSGAVGRVIMAVILICVNLFWCFFNNCGFSHFFYSNFWASKGKKYSPADTNEEEELKPWKWKSVKFIWKNLFKVSKRPSNFLKLIAKMTLRYFYRVKLKLGSWFE